MRNMHKKLPVLILALIILLQAFTPAVFAASENEAVTSTAYLCPFDPTSEGAGKAPQKVIGHYPEYVELSKELGTKPFSVPDKIWKVMTKEEQWAANQKFLDRAIVKGSEFNLATPIDKVRPGSYLQKEIEYLTSQGYKFSSDGIKFTY